MASRLAPANIYAIFTLILLLKGVKKGKPSGGQPQPTPPPSQTRKLYSHLRVSPPPIFLASHFTSNGICILFGCTDVMSLTFLTPML